MARVTDAHIEARKGQILDAAWTCFARDGYHRTTMQDIATEAGISAGAIYRYFDGKEAVLAGINQRSQEMGRALVAEAASATEDPIGTIAVIGRAMLRSFYDPEFETIARINIEIWPEALRHDELRRGMADEMRFWRTAVANLLSEARAEGDIRADVDPEATAQMLICAWEGLRHWRIIDDGFAPESLVELFRSLLTEQGTARQTPFDMTAPAPRLGIPHAMPAAVPRHDGARPRKRGRK
jgi:AcrR family transcriptional regulator